MFARIACLAGLAAFAAYVATTERRTDETATVLGSGDSLAAVISGVYDQPGKKRRNAKAASRKQPGVKLASQSRKPAKRTTEHASLRNLEKGYRTLCVRLCDGYYYPISAAAQPGEFARDEVTCRASCASPAMLFHYRNGDGSPEVMTDLEGRPYADLATAFQHRVAYDTACSCRASPWTEEAANRHRLYALEAEVAKAEETARDIDRRLLAAVVNEQERAARERTGADLVAATAQPGWKIAAAGSEARRAERSAKSKDAGRVAVVREVGREAVRRARVVRVASVARPAVRIERVRMSVNAARIRVADTRGLIRVSR